MTNEADKPAGGEVEDKDLHSRAYFDGMQMRYLRSLVCDEVIEEHRLKPVGQHSEALARLLHFFRTQPMPGKLAVLRDRTSQSYRIVALSGQRGERPRLVDDSRHATPEAAYHAIFLKQIQALMGA